jgi:PAS domain S-box-containing protein
MLIKLILEVATPFILGIIWIWKNWMKPILEERKKRNKSFDELKNNSDKIDFLIKRTDYIEKKIDGVIYLENTAMFVCDSEGLCILANDALCELFGAKESAMKGFGWMNFIVEEDREKAMKSWQQAINNGFQDLKTNYRIIHGETKEMVICTYHAIISRGEKNQVIISVGKVYNNH